MNRLNMPLRVDTQRLILQRLRYEDAEEMFYSYASKEQATRFVSWPTHQSIYDTRAFLKYAVPAWDEGVEYSYSIRLREGNNLVGGFGIVNEMGKTQFGYIISPAHWSNGFATEACRALLPLLKEQAGVFRIGSFVDIENLPSMKVLEKSGLTREGVLRAWMRFPNQGNVAKDCAVFVLS